MGSTGQVIFESVIAVPEISVIIPTYNYSSYILEAITSALEQMLPGDELIVIDDGSDDETRAVLEALIQEGRIHYYFQENSGVSAARNRGAETASRPYLYFLDADDRIAQGGLDILRKEAGSHPEAAMVFGGHISILENGKRRIHHQKKITDDNEKNFFDYVIKRRFSIANGGTALIKREVATKYPFPLDLKVSEDFCVFAWILANHECYSFEQPVVEVRKHSGSLRNQLPLYEQAVDLLPDELFDPIKLKSGLLKYKQRFRCQRLLSLFRAQYLSGEMVKARKTYSQALACRPLNIFKLSYLRKYLRLLWA